MANNMSLHRSLGASGSSTADMSAAKLNSMIVCARDVATKIRHLTGKYPWELIPECPDTSWSTNLLEDFCPFLKRCLKQSEDKNKVLDDIREFLVKEAQGHQLVDKTKLNANDLRKAWLQFCPDMERDSRPKLERKQSPTSSSKRGIGDTTSESQLESSINKKPKGGRNERGSQNANITLDFDFDKFLYENTGSNELVEKPGLFESTFSDPPTSPTSFYPGLDSNIDLALQLDQQARYDGIESNQQTASGKLQSVEQTAEGTTTNDTSLSDPRFASHSRTVPKMSSSQLEIDCSTSSTAEHAREVVDRPLKEMAEANTCHTQAEEKLDELQSRVAVSKNQLRKLEKKVGDAIETKAESEAESKALEDNIGSLKRILRKTVEGELHHAKSEYKEYELGKAERLKKMHTTEKLTILLDAGLSGMKELFQEFPGIIKKARSIIERKKNNG